MASIDETLNGPQATPQAMPQATIDAGLAPTLPVALELAVTMAAPMLESAAAEASFPVQSWDRYTFVRTLGQGGMGTVYEALDKPRVWLCRDATTPHCWTKQRPPWNKC